MTTPAGAVTSEIELMRLGIGHHFYSVLNLGRSSLINEYVVTSNSKVEETDWGSRRFIANQILCWNVYYDVPVNLMDNNIGGGGYNRHFLFTTKEAAEAYLAVALKDMQEDMAYQARCASDRDYDDYDDYADDRRYDNYVIDRE